VKSDAIVLRRYEVQVHYDTAFAWFDTSGTLAARWAYSGHFGRWGRAEDSITLSTDTSEIENRYFAAQYGARSSSFLAEGVRLKDARELTERWVQDCLTAGGPPTIRRIYVRMLHTLPIHHEAERARLQAALLKLFPLSGFLPSYDSATFNSGLSFNSRIPRGLEGELLTTAQFGIFTEIQMAGGFVSMQLPSDGALGGIGLAFDYDLRVEIPARNGMAELRAALNDCARLESDVRTRSLISVVADA